MSDCHFIKNYFLHENPDDFFYAETVSPQMKIASGYEKKGKRNKGRLFQLFCSLSFSFYTFYTYT